MSYRAFKIKSLEKDYFMIIMLPDTLTPALKKRLEDFDVVLKFSDIGKLDKYCN